MSTPDCDGDLIVVDGVLTCAECGIPAAEPPITR